MSISGFFYGAQVRSQAYLVSVRDWCDSLVKLKKINETPISNSVTSGMTERDINFKIKLEIATLISCSTWIFARYLFFITATVENRVSHKYDVAYGIDSQNFITQPANIYFLLMSKSHLVLCYQILSSVYCCKTT